MAQIHGTQIRNNSIPADKLDETTRAQLAGSTVEHRVVLPTQTVEITHNKEKYCNVLVLDDVTPANVVIPEDILHAEDKNSLTVVFAEPFVGTIVCS